MGYSYDENVTIGSSVTGAVVVGAGVAVLTIVANAKEWIEPRMLLTLMGLFIFIVMLPTLIISTLTNAVVLEVNEKHTLTQNRTSGTTGTSVSNLDTKAIGGATAIAIGIGLVLWLAHLVQTAYLTNSTILCIYVFIFAVVLLPSLIASTIGSDGLRESVQIRMATS
jgi:hypothetical protein